MITLGKKSNTLNLENVDEKASDPFEKTSICIFKK